MTSLQHRVEAARVEPTRVVLEGVHALKHAVRFGAEIAVVASPDPGELQRLLAELAPDVRLPVEVEAAEPASWTTMTRGGLPSPALAIAHRPVDRLDDVLARRGDGPVVVLEAPTHLGNVGAAVRVAAAAGADALLVVGDADPWHPRAVRGGAGLQFALPVARRDTLPDGPRPVVAIDPGGDDRAGARADDAVLVFGTERHGLSDELLARAGSRVRIPMRPGVSSLNLATSVAAVLYGPSSWA